MAVWEWVRDVLLPRLFWPGIAGIAGTLIGRITLSKQVTAIQEDVRQLKNANVYRAHDYLCALRDGAPDAPPPAEVKMAVRMVQQNVPEDKRPALLDTEDSRSIEAWVDALRGLMQR